jgi:hypothetical protein
MKQLYLFFSLLICLLVNSLNSAQIDEGKFLKLDGDYFYTRIWVLSSPNKNSIIILAGILHIAEHSYYSQIGDFLKKCDLVFYEGIHNPSKDPVSLDLSPKSELPISIRLAASEMKIDLKKVRDDQLKFAKDLDLVFQYESLDQSSNWILADMSFEEFDQAISNLGSEDLSLDKNSLAENDNEIREMSPDSSNPSHRKFLIRRKIAEEISESSMKINSNPKYANLLEALIKKRNLKVLQKISPFLNGSKSLGIIYGAAHMPDFLEKLKSDWGYQVISTRWIPAWSLKKEE